MSENIKEDSFVHFLVTIGVYETKTIKSKQSNNQAKDKYDCHDYDNYCVGHYNDLCSRLSTSKR